MGLRSSGQWPQRFAVRTLLLLHEAQSNNWTEWTTEAELDFRARIGELFQSSPLISGAKAPASLCLAGSLGQIIGLPPYSQGLAVSHEEAFISCMLDQYIDPTA